METGQVAEVLPDNYVRVAMKRTEACAKCGACYQSGAEMAVTAYNADNARISDRVSLNLESGYFLSSAVILYGLPLLALLIGAFTGYYGAVLLRLEQIAPVLGLASGVFFTAAAYLIIKGCDKKIKKSPYIPIAHKY